MFDRDSRTGWLSSASAQSVLDGVSYTEGAVAALALSADTLFVSVAGAASGGGGIGLYTINVRESVRTFQVFPETEIIACLCA